MCLFVYVSCCLFVLLSHSIFSNCFAFTDNWIYSLLISVNVSENPVDNRNPFLCCGSGWIPIFWPSDSNPHFKNCQIRKAWKVEVWIRNNIGKDRTRIRIFNTVSLLLDKGWLRVPPESWLYKPVLLRKPLHNDTKNVAGVTLHYLKFLCN